MKWLEIKKEEAEEKYSMFCNTDQFDYESQYTDLRNDLVSLFYSSLDAIGISDTEISFKNNSYKLDLVFGIKLFTILNEKYGMNVRLASTSGVWRYLSVCVIPDLVAKRYGKDHQDRFYNKAKRIWLRVLWWYIYLSWQGNEQETYDVLKGNSTDEILQLVDRCGRGGYRVHLYREIMKKNSEFDLSDRRKKQLFRKVMVLNTARVQVVEPELTIGGNKSYVDALYNYFE